MSQKYPVGIETFSEIIEGGYAYVDKTEVIYRLTQSGKYFFLSRPRRFGKSLMLSTIEAYFEGRKDLFDNLWLGQAEGVDWTPRPVLRLNFVESEASNVEFVSNLLDNHLSRWEAKYGVKDIVASLSQRFHSVIEKAYEVTGLRVVVLVDEYDKVLINTRDNDKRREEIEALLKSVFCVLKGADRYIEFAMFAGVNKLSKLSIYSDFNNLNDISLNPEFSSICGITEDEVRKYFKQDVEVFATVKDTNCEGMMQILKDNYGGYNFSRTCLDIYNPYSLINALDDREIKYTWFGGGIAKFLLEQICNMDVDIREVLDVEVSYHFLGYNDLVTQLYREGYLTIKSYDKEMDSFMLGMPNREVEYGMYKVLMSLDPGSNSNC